jgi:hypothetical protein
MNWSWSNMLWLLLIGLGAGAVAEFWAGPWLMKVVNGALEKRKLRKEQKKEQQTR